MTDIYIAFERLEAKQIFHSDGKEWVKCPSMMRSGDINYNAFINIEKEALAGEAVELKVRRFHPDDLVHIDSNQELFIPEIVSSCISSNDN
jgi:hypothetical protein